MEYDRNKIDEVVMALLYLTSFNDGGITRAWKGHDWDVLNRLFEKGWINDPKSKAKSVAITEEGVQASAELFKKHFAV
jgi:predicted transcriptional regulator